MSRLLVHLATGPEHPTRAALALLVARSAQQRGHDVDLFLAGDAVGLLRDATMDAISGVGTGSLREHFDALAEGGARFFASGMSSKARGVDADAVGGKRVEFAPPDRLVELALEADRVISYWRALRGKGRVPHVMKYPEGTADGTGDTRPPDRPEQLM